MPAAHGGQPHMAFAPQVRRKVASQSRRAPGAQRSVAGNPPTHGTRSHNGAGCRNLRKPTSGVGVLLRHGRGGGDTPEVGDGVGISDGGVDSGAAAGGCAVSPSAGDGARSRTPVLVNGSPPPPGGLPWPEPASHGAGSASWTHLSQTS